MSSVYTYPGTGTAFTGGAITTPITGANGSAAAPTYSFTAAPNYGWYYDSVNTSLAASAGGTEVVQITNNGGAGRLHIGVNNSQATQLTMGQAGTAGAIALGNWPFNGATNLLLFNASGTAYGGILLDRAYAAGGTTAASPAFASATSVNSGLLFPAANQVALATSGTTAFTIDASQNATFAAHAYGINGTAGAPAYSFTAATNYGINYNPSDADTNQTLEFIANGLKVIDIAQNGIPTFRFKAIFSAGLDCLGTLRCFNVVQVNTNNTNGFGLELGTQSQSPFLQKISNGYYQVSDFGTGLKPGWLLQGAYPVSKTTNYTLVFNDLDTHFDNTGAAGSVAFTLPTPQIGYRAHFCCTAAQTMTVVTPSGSIFGPGTLSGATRTISGAVASSQYSSFTVECKDGTNYIATAVSGTVT